MNISITQLLEKMNEEVHQAIQEASTQKERSVRDRLAAIKALCELAMDEQEKTRVISPMPAAFVEQKPLIVSSQISSNTAKSTAISDGANGESLFDF
ncbi:MAG TPA: YwdI family protein [Bacillus sp. (in: firmicutes)]|nr:YwdI family protein [Bacillus sp. (in: firmicutes)]